MAMSVVWMVEDGVVKVDKSELGQAILMLLLSTDLGQYLSGSTRS